MPHTDTLISQARSLSSGTLATLTGQRSYARMDMIQAQFVAWCEQQADQAARWQDVWHIFWRAERCPRSEELPTMPDQLCPTTLTQLEAILHAAADDAQAKIRRDCLEAEWRTKRRTMKAQAAPHGLFAQEQQTLFVKEENEP